MQRFQSTYNSNMPYFHLVLQIRNAQTTWNTWNVEIPVQILVLTQKEARFVKPHVQMAVSVLLVKHLLLPISLTRQGTKRDIVPFQLVAIFFLYDFTLKAVNKLFLLA